MGGPAESLGPDSGDELVQGGTRQRSDTLLSIGSIGGVLGLGGERKYSLSGIGDTTAGGGGRSDSIGSNVGIAGQQSSGTRKHKPQVSRLTSDLRPWLTAITTLYYTILYYTILGGLFESLM